MKKIGVAEKILVLSSYRFSSRNEKPFLNVSVGYPELTKLSVSLHNSMELASSRIFVIRTLSTVLCNAASAVHGGAPTMTLNALLHAVIPCSYGCVFQRILERIATLNTVQDTVHGQV